MEEQRQRQEDEARRAHQLQGNAQATSGQAMNGVCVCGHGQSSYSEERWEELGLGIYTMKVRDAC